MLDDSAAHISEETSNAARAAPIAILTGVGFTAAFGWLLFIAGALLHLLLYYRLTDARDPTNSVFCDHFCLRTARNRAPPPHGATVPRHSGETWHAGDMELHYRRPGELHCHQSGTSHALTSCSVLQYVTGAAQGVDASRVVFAFARDNALPGSRWWKKMNRRTATPVNAVWVRVPPDFHYPCLTMLQARDGILRRHWRARVLRDRAHQPRWVIQLTTHRTLPLLTTTTQRIRHRIVH